MLWQFQTTDSDQRRLKGARCFERTKKIPVTLDARYGLTRLRQVRDRFRNTE